MKSSRFACLFLGLLAAGAVHAETFKAAFNETHPFDPQGEIRLANVNGSVAIRTWDRAEVRVEGEKRASSPEDLKGLEVTIEVTSNALVIKTTYPSQRFGWFSWLWHQHQEEVHFTLTVPATARIADLGTVNADITIEGVRGAVKASTVNGNIHATGLQDDTAFSTVNGAIRAEFGALNSKRHLKFTTVNGSVTVALPKTAGATIAASTVNGGVSCDFPVQLTHSSRNRLDGTIGDGDASLKATTVNGGIHLESL